MTVTSNSERPRPSAKDRHDRQSRWNRNEWSPHSSVNSRCRDRSRSPVRDSRPRDRSRSPVRDSRPRDRSRSPVRRRPSFSCETRYERPDSDSSAALLLDYGEGEIRESSEDSRASSQGYSDNSRSSSNSSRSSYNNMSYLDDLFWNGRRDEKLSERLDKPEVEWDRARKWSHSGDQAAWQFNHRAGHVKHMLRHMYQRYDTVSVYSLALLEPGDIVYYLQAFPMGQEQNGQGDYVAYVGGPDCTARIKCKGRFGIVVAKHTQRVTVAPVYTFGGRGIAKAKPQWCWKEYVGLRETGQKDCNHPGPNGEPLEAGWSCTDISEDASVCLLTEKIGLNDQIMISGRLTETSLKRLCELIRKVDTC